MTLSGCFTLGQCLTCKQLRLCPGKHMVKMIMERVRNRSFTEVLPVTASKAVYKKIGLDSLLFNIHTYDLPSMIFRKFAYTDDLALLHSSRN